MLGGFKSFCGRHPFLRQPKMGVQNKTLLIKLYNLKLDQQSFGLTKEWMAIAERQICRASVYLFEKMPEEKT